MPNYPRAVVALAIAVSALLTGCVTHDPPPQASKPVPADVDTWQKISTKSWQVPVYEKREKALQMLQGKDWRRINANQYYDLTTGPQPTSLKIDLLVSQQLYLVKGRGYGAAGGKIRFQPKTRELSVFLAAYNGEMLIPGMRWDVKDIPVIVALPSAPTKVHQSAEIGGDGISRFMDHD
ncbi:hypothetical protein [Luteolibacter soli]|uniref:Lipoprotein n=1 Tax=Luteolibacter soli TaxID=3135280 RepID=A0ABU9B5I9_9BACT